MERFSQCLVCAAISVGLFAGTLSAEIDPSGESSPLADMSEDVSRLVRFVEELGNGDLDAAFATLEGHLSTQLQEADGPFERGSRENRRHQFGGITDTRPQFESVEVIGFRRVSSASRVLVLVANGAYGPVMFQFQMFRYGDDWRILGLGWTSDWSRIEAADNCERFADPVNYELPTEQSRVDEVLAIQDGDTDGPKTEE